MQLRDRGLRFVHHATGTEEPFVRFVQQAIGAVEYADQFFGVVFAAQQTGERAVRAAHALGDRLQATEAGVQGGVLSRHFLEVFEQTAHRRHDLRNLFVGIATQHRAFGARR